jgi:lipopolysaccharide assembly outer membrane protein LptD (OstA)
MRVLLIFISFFIYLGSALGQTPTPTNESEQDTAQGEKVRVIYADLQRTVKVGNDFDRFLEGNVQIIKDSTYFYCDTARLNDNFLKAWGDVSMIKTDSLEVYADSMIYDLETEEADIYGSVYIKNKDQVLFSDYIHYNDRVDIAYYTDKAILKNNNVVLKSKRGEFRTRQDLAIFSQKVSVQDEDFELYADTLLYNTALNKAIFQGPTNILMDSATVYCEAGYFLMDEERGLFQQNARYVSETDTAVAIEIKADGIKNGNDRRCCL